MNRNNSKKGQVTIFIIIGILIVVGIITIFIFRDSIFNQRESLEFSEVYESFESCVKDKTLAGIKIASFGGGYIYTNDLIFEAGNQYAPFSSQLDYLGNPVPYWYYISGNGLVREQVPSRTMIENQIERFLDDELKSCNFREFISQGLVINNSLPKSEVKIVDNQINVKVDMNLFVSKEDINELKSEHEVSIDSNFGKLFKKSIEIYNEEKEKSFLENFSVDVLYNYAPVTGSELSCKPLVWNPREVIGELQDALSANMAALKIKGDYYSLNEKSDDYFVLKNTRLELDEGQSVNFIYDKRWPTRIEVWPVEGNLMVSYPVGLEAGMGVLGFCYVPYHFVYDVYYPVLVQLNEGDDFFMFPVSVVIDKSVARNAIESSENAYISQEGSVDQICNYRNSPMTVYTFDSQINGVEADISFECLGAECTIGKTEKVDEQNSLFSGNFPSCVNGKIIAKADGYVDSEYIVSTNQGGIVNILMNKLYELPVELYVDGRKYEGKSEDMALINFASEDNSQSINYPLNNVIKISEGYYNISVSVFSSSSLVIPASSTRQCVKTLAPGILGFFGKTNEECFDIAIPATKLDNILSAGGKASEYILESEIMNARVLKIRVNSLPSVKSLDDLGSNYELFEVSNLEVSFE